MCSIGLKSGEFCGRLFMGRVPPSEVTELRSSVKRERKIVLKVSIPQFENH